MSTLTSLKTTTRWLVTMTAIACATGSRAALADDPVYITVQKTVSYADLDLSQPAGAQMLYGRIKKAASSVCGELEDTQAEHRVLFRECYDQAVANAVAKANRPTLTALYNSTTSTKG
jgi:UrcA family protein